MKSVIMVTLLCASGFDYGHEQKYKQRGVEICERAMMDCFKWRKDSDCLDVAREQFERKSKEYGTQVYSMRGIVHWITSCALYAPPGHQCKSEESHYYWRPTK